ncbi:TIGR00730 family Rossman fold protein [Ideonella sp. DXS29W]|uniref:Cytokinin riboside 5'-monophosphate phosphoribohydrolase n=1 Tax=Ideonella lacteola TaxID=2984193 RepID=A0ABU9BPI8_9BURK
MNTSASRPAPFSLCVYCGSRFGNSPAYLDAAQALGREIARRGWRLVYGGGNVGLMGATADAAMSAGAEVVGVIPEKLLQREVGHRGVTELHVVQTMHERKKLMAELADGFVALPGGIGTFEELFEVWTWRHLGYHDQPIGLLNIAGFYDPLLAFMHHTQQAGFVDEEQQGMLAVGNDPVSLLDQLASAARKASQLDDFSRI